MLLIFFARMEENLMKFKKYLMLASEKSAELARKLSDKVDGVSEWLDMAAIGVQMSMAEDEVESDQGNILVDYFGSLDSGTGVVGVFTAEYDGDKYSLLAIPGMGVADFSFSYLPNLLGRDAADFEGTPFLTKGFIEAREHYTHIKLIEILHKKE